MFTSPNKITLAPQHKRILAAGIGAAVTIICILIYLYWGFIQQTILYAKLSQDLTLVFNPLKYRNFFGTIGAIALGWLIYVPDTGRGPLVNGLLSVTGLILCAVGMLTVIRIRQKPHSNKYVIGFFLLWIVLFYIPNWLYEPRLILGSERGYITISSIGTMGLLAYILARVTRPALQTMVVAVYILLNAFYIRASLDKKMPYRLRSVTADAWNLIDDEIPAGKHRIILNLTGDDPYKTHIFNLIAPAPFNIKRDIRSPSDAPIVTESKEQVIDILCASSSAGSANIPNRPASLEAVYAFHIYKTTQVVNVTSQFRKSVQDLADQIHCAL